MPVVLKVPFGDKTHRLTITSAAAKELATLPRDQHASFTEGLLRMIRLEAPKEKKEKRVRKRKPHKREVTEAINDGVTESST
jgi:hypothetical protein